MMRFEVFFFQAAVPLAFLATWALTSLLVRAAGGPDPVEVARPPRARLAPRRLRPFRVRFTLKRLMVMVAVAGLSLAALKASREWMFSRFADGHARQEARLRRAEPGTGPELADYRRRLADYHGRMGRAYRQANGLSRAPNEPKPPPLLPPSPPQG